MRRMHQIDKHTRKSGSQAENNPIVQAQAQTERLLENADALMRGSEHLAKPRTLLMISQQPPSTLQNEIAADREPRRDYYALQHALDADVLYMNDTQTTFLARLIARLLGKQAALVWAAFRRRHAYDILYTQTEKIGLPLAI